MFKLIEMQFYLTYILYIQKNVILVDGFIQNDSELVQPKTQL